MSEILRAPASPTATVAGSPHPSPSALNPQAPPSPPPTLPAQPLLPRSLRNGYSLVRPPWRATLGVRRAPRQPPSRRWSAVDCRHFGPCRHPSGPHPRQCQGVTRGRPHMWEGSPSRPSPVLFDGGGFMADTRCAVSAPLPRVAQPPPL
jgi:hypothetical protein